MACLGETFGAYKQSADEAIHAAHAAASAAQASVESKASPADMSICAELAIQQHRDEVKALMSGLKHDMESQVRSIQVSRP